MESSLSLIIACQIYLFIILSNKSSIPLQPFGKIPAFQDGELTLFGTPSSVHEKCSSTFKPIQFLNFLNKFM